MIEVHARLGVQILRGPAERRRPPDRRRLRRRARRGSGTGSHAPTEPDETQASSVTSYHEVQRAPTSALLVLLSVLARRLPSPASREGLARRRPGSDRPPPPRQPLRRASNSAWRNAPRLSELRVRERRCDRPTIVTGGPGKSLRSTWSCRCRCPTTLSLEAVEAVRQQQRPLEISFLGLRPESVRADVGEVAVVEGHSTRGSGAGRGEDVDVEDEIALVVLPVRRQADDPSASDEVELLSRRDPPVSFVKRCCGYLRSISSDLRAA